MISRPCIANPPYNLVRDLQSNDMGNFVSNKGIQSELVMTWMNYSMCLFVDRRLIPSLHPRQSCLFALGFGPTKKTKHQLLFSHYS